VRSGNDEETEQYQDIVLKENRLVGKKRQWCQSSCSYGQTYTDRHEFTFEEARQERRDLIPEFFNECRGSFEGKYDLSENCLIRSLNDDESLSQAD